MLRAAGRAGHKPRPELADDDAANHVMDGWNQMPDLEGFREAVETYYACCADVCEELLDAATDTDSQNPFMRLRAAAPANVRALGDASRSRLQRRLEAMASLSA